MGTFVHFYMFTCIGINGIILLKDGVFYMTKGYEQRKKSNQKYLSTLDEIKIRVPKGKKEEYRQMAEDAGKSLNQFIIDKIEEV